MPWHCPSRTALERAQQDQKSWLRNPRGIGPAQTQAEDLRGLNQSCRPTEPLRLHIANRRLLRDRSTNRCRSFPKPAPGLIESRFRLSAEGSEDYTLE